VLRRFWLEFEFDPGPDGEWRGVPPRFGVTGWDIDDCLGMIRDWMGRGTLPPLVRVIEDVDLSTFELYGWESLGVPVWRGIWCPAYNRDLSGSWPQGRRGTLENAMGLFGRIHTD
jgi:hypothetical protein